MPLTLFPKPKPALAIDYARDCSLQNLKYILYFSIITAVIFAGHLVHHFRLGMHALSAEMIPYTLLYSLTLIYSLLNIAVLRYMRNVPALSPVAAFLEVAFPCFVTAIAVILSIQGVQFGQGVTPFASIMLCLGVLLQGQLGLMYGLALGGWLVLSLCLAILFGSVEASPSIAISLTTAMLAVFIANFLENTRIRQFQLIHDLQHSNRQLQLLSSQDHLTGLMNRRSFDRGLEREMSRSERFGHPLSLLMIDIDDFKSVNDNYGHVFGDNLIKKVAECIRSHVRDVDYVGRLGGDEFVVLLVETDKPFALQIADRMRREVTNMKTNLEFPGVTISVGHAQSKGESVPAFLERADKALYDAKRAGKNRVKTAQAGAA